MRNTNRANYHMPGYKLYYNMPGYDLEARSIRHAQGGLVQVPVQGQTALHAAARRGAIAPLLHLEGQVR